MSSKGFYRSYFNIGKIGFKFARINFNDANPFIGFLTACIMNVLERKRYKYYCCGKRYRQWGRWWKYEGEKPIFCPTYFTCGIFNIVKHLDIDANEINTEYYYFCKTNKLCTGGIREDLEKYLNEKTNWMCWNDIKCENFKFDNKGNLYCIDYGDFTLGNTHSQCACLIDYK